MTHTDRDRRRIQISSVTGVLLGGLVFWLVLLDFGTDLTRTANALGYASGFFEVQSEAFLDGHIWVPDKSMGIEGFELGGHTYMYFGPFPALLRIPILLVTHDFNGQMTLLSMGLAWLIFVVMFARLVWLVRDCLYGATEVSRTHAVLAATLLAGAAGGTTLTFDAALPWAYHEVYLWQTAFVITAAYWMVRVAREPDFNGIRWLAVAALGAVLTRTTGGWGTCLGIVALALWMRFGSSWQGRRRFWGLVLAAGVVPLAIGIAFNMAKFGHPFMFPLQDQVWTDVNAHRREALRVNGGSITGLQFFTTSLNTYFSPAGIRFVDYFPWITFPPENARAVGGAFIDQSYRTGSVTAFMPGFLLLSLAALPVLIRRTGSVRHGEDLRALRAPAFATFVMTGGVMAYGYLAFRYTTEFVPALLFFGTVSVWAYLGRLQRAGRGWRVLGLGALALAMVWSMVAITAVGVSTSWLTKRGERGTDYVSLQNRLSGGPGSALASMVTVRSTVPSADAPLPADTLWIRGKCDALYLATGDDNEPWQIIEDRYPVLSVLFGTRARNATVTLFESSGKAPRRVVMRSFADGTAQIWLENEDGVFRGQIFEPVPGEPVRVGVRTDTSLGYAEITSTPGGFVGYLPIQEWDQDWLNRVAEVSTPYTERTEVAKGIVITPEAGIDPPLCRRLAATNGIELK